MINAQILCKTMFFRVNIVIAIYTTFNPTNSPVLVVDGQGGGVGGSQYLLLETIVEETSDDLRSESSCSGPAGWPDSDSDTASVIHVCSIGKMDIGV